MSHTQSHLFPLGKGVAVLYHSARVFIAGLFLFAAFSKLTDINAFAQTIFAFGFMPEGLIHIAAIATLGAEISAALLLIFDRKGGLLLLTLLTTLFIGVLGYGIWTGLDIDCGCFGASDPTAEILGSLRTSLIRNLFLIAIMAFIQWARGFLDFTPKSFACFQ